MKGQQGGPEGLLPQSKQRLWVAWTRAVVTEAVRVIRFQTESEGSATGLRAAAGLDVDVKGKSRALMKEDL